MQENRLDDRAVEKIIGGVPNMIVQALDVIQKNRRNQNFYG